MTDRNAASDGKAAVSDGAGSGEGTRSGNESELCPDCKAPLGEHEQGFCPHEIETGERYAESELTGNTYLVTKWAEKGDGRMVSLRKAPVEGPAGPNSKSDGDRDE